MSLPYGFTANAYYQHQAHLFQGVYLPSTACAYVFNGTTYFSNTCTTASNTTHFVKNGTTYYTQATTGAQIKNSRFAQQGMSYIFEPNSLGIDEKQPFTIQSQVTTKADKDLDESFCMEQEPIHEKKSSEIYDYYAHASSELYRMLKISDKGTCM